MPNGRLRKAVDRSIKTAVGEGRLDLDAQSATIGMLRYMADQLDRAGVETSILRNISPTAFLSYCQALGFTVPEGAPRRGKRAEPDPDDEKVVPASTLEAFRARHRRGA